MGFEDIFAINICTIFTGQALEAQGDLRGAAFAYRRALELNSQYQDAQEALITVGLATPGRMEMTKMP